MRQTNGTPGQNPQLAQIILVAVWFGLAGGLLEGLVKWGLPVAGLAGKTRFCLGDLKVLWAPVAVDVALFLVLGLLLFPIAHWLRRWPWLVIAAGFFSMLAFYGLLSVTGRFRERGAIALAVGLGVVAERWMQRDPAGWLRLLRKSFLPVLVLVLGACILPWPAAALQERIARSRSPQPPAGAPSVLLLVLDSARADRLESYGYARPTTPFLDEYVRQAVLFERAVANSSWSLPSHVSLLTGRLPREHGGETIGQSFAGGFPTLAEVLAARGYATAGFVANAGYASCARGLSRGFNRYEDSFALRSQIMDRVYAAKLHKYILARLFEAEPPREWITAEQVNRKFLAWLDDNGSRPFFAMLNYMELHYPYAPPREFAARFSQDLRPVRPREWLPMRHGERELDPALVRRASDHYDASLAYLDAQLRALFSELRRREIEENLLVVVTSDHGESFGEHGLLEHQISLYADQIHVPLVVRLPGRTPAGKRVAATVGLDQVAATVAKLVGAGDHPFPGLALDAFWADQPPPEHAVISEVSGGPWPGVPKNWPIYQGGIRSLVTGRWHLLVPDNGPVELYDWLADPREEHNLAADPQYAEVVRSLRERLPIFTPASEE